MPHFRTTALLCLISVNVESRSKMTFFSWENHRENHRETWDRSCWSWVLSHDWSWLRWLIQHPGNSLLNLRHRTGRSFFASSRTRADATRTHHGERFTSVQAKRYENIWKYIMFSRLCRFCIVESLHTSNWYYDTWKITTFIIESKVCGAEQPPVSQVHSHHTILPSQYGYGSIPIDTF